MKHIFVLNPAAGVGKAEKRELPHIIEAAKNKGVEYEIHRTIGARDAENYVRRICARYPDARLRFYAVGGDGTLNEVANGALGFKNAEIGFIPAGTGNDFVRIFSNPNYFSDIERQLEGTAEPIDLISYGDRVIVNVLNIGLDCAVVSEKKRLQEKKILRGPLAYLAGVGVVFAYNKGVHLKVEIEEEDIFDGVFTLIAVGNGSYYGGGFKGVPDARVDDGLLDVSLISKVNRRTFASLIAKYRKGTHLGSPLAKRFITYKKCSFLTIEPQDTVDICVDGEIFSSGKIKVTIIPKAIKFSIPRGSALK